MKSRSPIVAGLGAAALVVAAMAPVIARAHPPVWLAVHGRTRLLLFGSVHLLPRGLDWATPTLRSAEARARTVWFEMPIDAASDAAASGETLARGQAPAGSTLFTLLPERVAGEVRRAAGVLGVPPQSLDRFQPWLADLTLTLRADLLAGSAPASGVERQVQAAVPVSTKRRAFETASEQIDLLADAALTDQIASLEATANEIVERPRTYQILLGEWLAGDLPGLRRDGLEPLRRASPALFHRLITARNQRWADILAREAEPGLSVVVVGVGHMVGPDGLPALLRARGFNVVELASGLGAARLN